ncbi:MAG TPA: hypothetical protein VFR35_05660, partial [Actinoplanes sp.]|nr:hypothetical protein [Actinoplanes sp.]
MSRHAAPRGRRGRASPGSRPPAPPPGAWPPAGAPGSAGSWPGTAAAPSGPDARPGVGDAGRPGGPPAPAGIAPGTAASTGAVRLTHLAAALLAVVITAGLVVATRWDRPGVLVAVAALQAVLVPAWVYGTALPGRIGGTLIGLGAAAAADAALVVRDRVSLLALLGVLGLVLPALALHQLTRGVVRVRVTESLAGIALLVTAVVALSVLVALARAVDGPRLVAALAAGAGAGLA